MQVIIVKGLASQKIIKELSVQPDQLDMLLLDFLTQNKLPIASSCNGMAACHKCVFNKKILSCTAKVREYIGKTIEFDYL